MNHHVGTRREQRRIAHEEQETSIRSTVVARQQLLRLAPVPASVHSDQQTGSFCRRQGSPRVRSELGQVTRSGLCVTQQHKISRCCTIHTIKHSSSHGTAAARTENFYCQ
eukprot:scpid47316/ scgid25532/ 